MQPRELAQRSTGTDEVRLLWHPDSNSVELCVRDLATDVSFYLDVAAGDAMDAFYHPYAYAWRLSEKRGRSSSGSASQAAA